jgi:CRISPR system Cascade subunit CasA
MNKAFNLLDEKWIPVRYVDGRTDQLGLSHVFADAGRINGLAETEPPAMIALYRVLLAITHRALTRHCGRWTVSDMARWYRDGLPLDAIDDYLTHWRERFWLFHPEHPFMQVAALAVAEETRDKFKPWTQIALDAANGSTPVLFDHSMDDAAHPIGAASVLRKLLGFLQFTPGGLVKVLRTADNAGPLANTAAVLPFGDTLAHTLCLALHPATREGEDDPPSWERTPPTLVQLRAPATLANGPNDRYTRLSRAVLLCQDESGGDRITAIRFAEGLALAEDENARDPMTSCRAGTNGMVRLGFTEGRALWRDLGTLLPDGSGKLSKPAKVLESASTLFERVKASDNAVLMALVAGVASDQAKLLRWRAERLVLPEALLRVTDAADLLRDRLREAESLYSQLRTILSAMLVETMPDPGHKDTRNRARSIIDAGAAAPSYFSALERSLPRLLDLSARQCPDQLIDDWHQAMCRAAGEAWSVTIADLGNSAPALRARVKAEPRYLGLLKPLRNPSLEPSGAPSAPQHQETIA